MIRFIPFFLVLISFHLQCQLPLLTIHDFYEKCLSNNYDIRLQKIAKEIAETNYTKANAGLVPRVSLNASNNISEGYFANKIGGNDWIDDNTFRNNLAGGLNLDYLLFNGGGNKIAYQILNKNINLQDAIIQQQIETSLSQIATQYYSVGLQVQQKQAIIELIKLSQERVRRTEANYEFAVGTKLDILNATVDLKNDSTTILQLSNQIDILKENLLLIAGESNSYSFIIYSVLPSPTPLNLDVLLEAAKNNPLIKAQEEGIAISTLQIQQAEARLKPIVNFVAGVGSSHVFDLNTLQNSALARNQELKATGSNRLGAQVTSGITLTYPIYDGNLRKTQIAIAELNLESRKIEIEKTLASIRSQIMQAWRQFEYQQQLLNLESSKLTTANLNAERSKEAFNRGLINSLQLREAQLNLIRTKTSIATASYNTYLAELELHRLTGGMFQYLTKE